MTKNIFEKELVLTRVDFDRDSNPRLKFANFESSEIINWTPEFEQEITLKINTSERFCCGWHSLETGEDFVCPDQNSLDKKYENCQACQKRTGFDPAFYNASQGEISAQQIERNSQPHLVYLAYFSGDIIKVGITFAGRGNTRLLEQGARAALILGEFSTANIARSHEEKIAKMTQFVENVKVSTKLKLLETKFENSKAETALQNAKNQIEASLGAKFDNAEVQFFDKFYSKTGEIASGEIINATDCEQNSGEKITFSGKLKAQVGYIWLAEQQGEVLAIPLRKFVGYPVKLSPNLTSIELPERQSSLFDF